MTSSRRPSTVREESYASVREARAYQIGEFLLLQIAGDLPSPCHLVDIERSPLDVEPPQFAARLSVRLDAKCAQVLTPYEHADAFHIGGPRDEVTLHSAEGELAVRVQDLKPDWDPGEVAESAGTGLLASYLGEPGEAIGYSNAYDLGEAMRDAIAQLPPQGGGIPDWLARYEVVSIGAEIGGIAGLNRLCVKVRG
jgi:hypothetical protein